MAVPLNVVAFPVTGRSHGLAAAPAHGQVALGTNKVALALGGPVWGPRATFLAPSATWPWPGAAARPGAIPLIGNAITLIGNAITLNGNAIRLNENARVGRGGPEVRTAIRNRQPPRPPCWALVSEPGFSDFHIFRFPDFEMFDFRKIDLKKTNWF